MLVDRLTPDDPSYAAVGRTVGQALEIDGHTYLTGAAGVAPGQMVDVEIVDAEEYDLVGRPLDD